MEHGAFLVEQVVDTEFDPSLDNPSQGPIVVVNGVVDEERVVWSPREFGRGERQARVEGPLKQILHCEIRLLNGNNTNWIQ